MTAAAPAAPPATGNGRSAAMSRPAPADHPIHDLLRYRWSPRAFSEKPVEPEKILSLLEAVRWAPSSLNEQPWSVLVASREERDEFDRLLGVLMESNRVWARRAPVLILAVARLAFGSPAAQAYGLAGKPNRHALYDVGSAVENLAIQATALGLAAHPMGGFDAEKARTLFRIPEGHEPVSVIALGHPGDLESLPPALRERELAPRSREPLSAFVFHGRWGEAYPALRRQQGPRA